MYYKVAPASSNLIKNCIDRLLFSKAKADQKIKSIIKQKEIKEAEEMKTMFRPILYERPRNSMPINNFHLIHKINFGEKFREHDAIPFDNFKETTNTNFNTENLFMMIPRNDFKSTRISENDIKSCIVRECIMNNEEIKDNQNACMNLEEVSDKVSSTFSAIELCILI